MYQFTESQIRIVKAIQTPGADHKNWYRTIAPAFAGILGKKVTEADKDEILTHLIDLFIEMGECTTAKLKTAFNVAFSPDQYRSQENPVDRVIAEICGYIQSARVGEHQLKVKRKVQSPANVLDN